MHPSPTTYVVLGLVAKRPGSGYDIAAFADHSLRYFWPISRSQLYSELSRLEQMGWARGTAVHQDRYPDKRVYEPTPAGLAALGEWLDDPQGLQRQRTQDAVVFKTFLGAYMNPDRLAEQLREYRAQAEELHAKLSAVVEHFAPKEASSTRRFGRVTARYGVLQAEATIAWVLEVQALLEAESESMPPVGPRNVQRS